VSGGIGHIVATGRLRRLFWRVADDLDYLWTLATLRLLDGLAGPLPEPADPEANIVADGLQHRERMERVRSTVIGS
jgi:hypothetical protein